MDHPYISLTTESDMSDQNTKDWLLAVEEVGPPGIVASTELHPDKNPMSFYKRHVNNNFCYIVVLARSLNEDEVKKIVERFSQLYPDGDFEVSFSQEPIQDNSHEELQENIINAVALEAAKRSHSKWMNHKLTEGWRFGGKFSSNQKVSPILKDWTSLSDKYRQAEIDRMSTLLEVLNDMNLRLKYKG